MDGGPNYKRSLTSQSLVTNLHLISSLKIMYGLGTTIGAGLFSAVGTAAQYSGKAFLQKIVSSKYLCNRTLSMVKLSD